MELEDKIKYLVGRFGRDFMLKELKISLSTFERRNVLGNWSYYEIKVVNELMDRLS